MQVGKERLTVSGDHKPGEKTCWSTPTVYHAIIVIFLEFFAFGLLTTPMISVVKGFLSFFRAPFLDALSHIFVRKPFFLLTSVIAVRFSFALTYVTDITTEEDRSWGYSRFVSTTFAVSPISSPALGAYLDRVHSIQ
ncbi:unnamed protein product [Trichobilharzia regenti]|nr:unnamed protein product [Trichobilharzia regenti]